MRRQMTARYTRHAEMPSAFYEKHLIITQADGQPLKIPPTRREACLRSALGAGAQVQAKSLPNGLLITVHSFQHSQLMQKLTKLSTGTSEVPVKCVPHNSLNYTKGVLHDKFGELAEEEPEHLMEALAQQGVVDINRIMITPSQGGPRVPGKTYFLTFLRDDLLQKVKVGSELFPIQEYRARPQFCGNCLRYGHVAKFCRSKAKCRKCGSEEHPIDACRKETVTCNDCALEHSTGNKECSKYKREEEVLNVMNREHLLPRDARDKVDKLLPPRQPGPTQAQLAAAAHAKAEAEKAAIANQQIISLKGQVAKLESIVTDLKSDMIRMNQENIELRAKLETKDEQLKVARFELDVAESELTLDSQLPAEPAAVMDTQSAPTDKPRTTKETPASKSPNKSQPEAGLVESMAARYKQNQSREKRRADQIAKSPGNEKGGAASLPKKLNSSLGNEFKHPKKPARPGQEPPYSLQSKDLLSDNRFSELSREEKSHSNPDSGQRGGGKGRGYGRGGKDDRDRHSSQSGSGESRYHVTV